MVGITVPAVLLALVSTTDIQLKSSTVSPETLREAEIVLREMIDMRERLQTGIVHSTGSVFRAASNEQSANNGPVEIYSAFDFPAGLFRFDLSYVQLVDSKYQTVRMKFVRTPERTLIWGDYHPDRLIVDNVDKKPSGMQLVFDMRVLGLTGPAGLRGVNMQTLDGVCKGFSKVEVAAVVEEGHNFRLDTQSLKNKYSKASLWVDRTKGCTPVRLEMRSGNTKPYQSVTEISWIEASGTWVPSAFAMTNHREGRLEDKVELEFSWERVNNLIDESLFSEESLGLPGHTEVVSRELGGTEIHLGTIGGTTLTPSPPKPRRPDTWLVFLLATGTLTLVAAALAMKRRIRQIRRSQTADQEAGTQP